MKEPQPPIIPPTTPATTITTTLTTINPNPKAKPLCFLVIGAGSRGTAYARAVSTATTGRIHAVAEPHAFKRAAFGRAYIWGEKGRPAAGQEFSDWREWLVWERGRRERARARARASVKAGDRDGTENEDGDGDEGGVDGVFICTLDETHVEIVTALAPLGLHILCEKPLALSMEDCLRVYGALSPAPESNRKPIFSIGHVLRYSPHNTLLRRMLLSDRVVGDIVSLEHAEPVGWWHFAHSYVRGNWRRETPARDGSLLTKSCHDIDFILWLLCSPPPPQEGDGGPTDPPHPAPASKRTATATAKAHLPRSIASTGHLTQFRRARKPAAAGAATNCLACPIERECKYSAVRIYRDMHLARGERGWPVQIVVPDIEDVGGSASASARAGGDGGDGDGDGFTAAEEQLLLRRLGEDYVRGEMDDAAIAARPWYGRCVWESDNDVCDDQVVTITWDDEDGDGSGRMAKTAVFHMIAPTEKQCERRGRVYGTRGELSYDSRTISVYDFATRTTTSVDVPRQPPEEEKAHGGGDFGLARSFVRAVDAVENLGWDVERAQAHFVGCTLEEAVRSHAVVFAAEEARREEKVVRWKDWWEQKLGAAGIQL
ncbi:Gfo/Idh/MocA family protein [Aspergillus clavatus NRRL 1]|uniref:NAD binding Rossmann fold oxidoreductase, putative n=1 Tax=Aspergillus clavatus (strain ATCC 1007 / CBS 513.65 / DSM 816 / NCTC 3887 / NRRL 1 / QM 1276 / 107) TaxID=344612 RepID=A1CKT3_ASPCL|nr:NAD binding Rossmann fold oxidoreductase, putative [Aspergillus clavatus NRRL 1]EAW09757.1 NAD binding Rossmann fold oxidoreductase, putative [Aspergillus clavatus NRRL 1]